MNREDGQFGRIEKIKEQIIETLQAQYARGSLSIEEYERLLSRTQNIGSERELEIFVDELPDFTKRPGREADSSIDSYARNSCRGEIYGWERDRSGHYPSPSGEGEAFVAVLGERHVRGVWYPMAMNKVFSFMGNILLDFSQAVLSCPVTEVSVFCLLSEVKVKVPAGVGVVMNGVPILGSFEDKTTQTSLKPSHIIKISGVAILSSVKAKEII